MCECVHCSPAGLTGEPLTEMREGHGDRKKSRNLRGEWEEEWGVEAGAGPGGAWGKVGEKACGLEEPLGAWGQMSAGPLRLRSRAREAPFLPQAGASPGPIYT